jgi:hypothetical protein
MGRFRLREEITLETPDSHVVLDVLTAATMRSTVLWVVTPCSPLEV